MLDNYDSFTYNLVHYLGELGEEVEVYRNDKITVDEVEKLNPEIIMISPGPCTPKEAGISVELVKRFQGRKPILGVCLGHQSIGEAFGAKIVKATKMSKNTFLSLMFLGVKKVCNTFSTIIGSRNSIS